MAGRLGNRSRFAIAYLLLGAAVGTGIGIFIVLLREPAPQPAPPWSSWRPVASTVDTQVVEIANHVGPAYRLPSGNQLASVRIGNPGGENLRAIGIPTTSQPQTLGDFQLFDRSSSVIYVLCGTGKDCKINEGKATKARGTVLRREALELALYTLQYAEPIDNVLVFFPPSAGQKTLTWTLFFHRSELESRLENPLRKTLPQAQPPLPGKIRAAEKQTVDQLTKRILFRYIRTLPVEGFGSMVILEPAA
jgi:hypothetical protein